MRIASGHGLRLSTDSIMTDDLKVRLRLATPTAMMDGRKVDVVLPPSMLPLNDYLVAELVEDHPTFIKSADLDADLSDEGFAELLDAAIEHTMRSHQFRSGIVKAPLGGGETAEIHAIMGPSPWTTAAALALASGWCPREELAGAPLRVAIPARSIVFYVAESAVQADPRLGAALDALAREGYEKAEDREALFPGSFIAAEGRLQATQDYGTEAVLDVDGAARTSVEPTSPTHVTIRRVLAAIVEALTLSEPEMAGGFVELASQSLDAGAELGGGRFISATARVLERTASAFPEWLRPSALAVASALDSGREPELAAAVRDTMAAIDRNKNRRLADIEAQMKGLDPWFAGDPVLAPAALESIHDRDLPEFVHRVGWLALAELRPHVATGAAHDIVELGTRALSDGTNAWIDVVPAALAILERHIDCDPAVRLAYARLSASITLVHRGLRFELRPSSTRRLLTDLISTWQWVRGVVATSPPTTPVSWPTDAAEDARRLLAQWNEHGGAAWLIGWQKTMARLAEKVAALAKADDATIEAQKEHLDAAAAAVAALRQNSPPEAADANDAVASKLDELAAARPGVRVEARGTARFLDGETADELGGPHMAKIVGLFTAAIWLTCGRAPSSAQAQLAADFLATRSTATLAVVHDRCVGEDPLAQRLSRAWSAVGDDGTAAMLMALVHGNTELKRCPDADATRTALRALLGDITGRATSWWGLRSGPGTKDRNRLDNVLRMLDV
jgi:hypothetical protein